MLFYTFVSPDWNILNRPAEKVVRFMQSFWRNLKKRLAYVNIRVASAALAIDREANDVSERNKRIWLSTP